MRILDYGARMYDPEIARWTTVDPMAEKYYPYSPYNYTLGNPVKYIDIDGLQPGIPFPSQNAAALNWGNYYNGKSILIGREMGSSIYSERIGDKTVYIYTEAAIGSNSGVTVSGVPKGKTRVATIHSHGKYDSGYRNNEFSPADKNNANKRNADNYAATPNGSLKRYDPSTEIETTISTELPSDPADPDRKNTNDPTDVPLNEDRERVTEEQNIKPEVQPIFESGVKWVF